MSASASPFEVTDEMRSRHAEWVDRYADAIFKKWLEGGQVDRDPESANRAMALVRNELRVGDRPVWMHPLDAIAIKVIGEPVEVPHGEARVDHFDSMRTMSGMTSQQLLYWTSKWLGIGMAQAREYGPDRDTHDLSGPSCLYRYYDARGVLLYVGITKDPIRRRRDHQSHSEWYPHAVEPLIEWFEDRKSALRAERDAIRDEAPVFNVVGARGLSAPYAPLLI